MKSSAGVAQRESGRSGRQRQVSKPAPRSSTQFTTKNFNIREAPARIELLGDKTKKPEPATHIIEFPGGAIELSRTSDGDYWAHIIVNRDWADPDQEGRMKAFGEVVGSRIGLTWPHGIIDVPQAEHVYQIAVLVRPIFPKSLVVGGDATGGRT